MKRDAGLELQSRSSRTGIGCPVPVRQLRWGIWNGTDCDAEVSRMPMCPWGRVWWDLCIAVRFRWAGGHLCVPGAAFVWASRGWNSEGAMQLAQSSEADTNCTGVRDAFTPRAVSEFLQI